MQLVNQERQVISSLFRNPVYILTFILFATKTHKCLVVVRSIGMQLSTTRDTSLIQQQFGCAANMHSI